MNTTDKMAEALRLAHDHIEMDKLLVSHPRDWALIKDALAYEAEAKPAPAPLTNADVVEAWRTTEARRDDYGWTSCEWFQEGVRFAQRHYRGGAAAPAAPAPLTDEQISELAHEMVKGGKSINWLLRAIERAHGIGKGGAA